MAIQSLTDLQKQLAAQSQKQAQMDAQAPRTAPRPAAMGAFAGNQAIFSKQNAAQAAQQDAAQAASNQYAIAGGDPTRDPTAAMDRIIGIGEDTYQNAANSQIDSMLQAELQKRITGGDQPYNATTINAFQTGAANQSAAAEQARNAQMQSSLEARGFKPGDPAYQAAMAQSMTTRQGQNQAANLDIAQKANLANYDAKGQAMGQANQFHQQQQNAQLQAAQLTQSNLNQVSAADRNKTPGWKQLPSYNQWQGAQAKPANS